MIISQTQKSILTKLLVNKLDYKLWTYINEEKKQVYNKLLEKLNGKDFSLDKEESIELAKLIKRFNEIFNKQYPLKYAINWLDISVEIMQELENKDYLLDVLDNMNIDYIKDIYSCKVEYRARNVLQFISKLKESAIFINYMFKKPEKIGFLFNNCEWTEFPLKLDVDIFISKFIDAECLEGYIETNFNKISKSEVSQVISNCNMLELAISEITSQNIVFFNELLKPIEQ